MTLLINSNQMDNLDENLLRSVLEKRYSEFSTIDYKKDITRKNANNYDAAFEECLKDITAFANARGGLIIIGADEPENISSVDEQLKGIDDGEDFAGRLESVVINITPRINGLLIKSIPISSGGFAIVIYIPPSQNRPHMVVFKKKNIFYIRHSTSSLPMTIDEIRASVLASATDELKAKSYCDKELNFLQNGSNPVWVFQAISILPLEAKLDVYSNKFSVLLRGDVRHRKYLDYPIWNFSADPIINGVRGSGSNSALGEKFTLEVHNNGFIQLSNEVPYHPEFKARFFYDKMLEIPKAYLDICKDIWNYHSIDSAYLFRCRCLAADKTRFLLDNLFGGLNITDPYERNIMEWEDQIRMPGQNTESIYENWAKSLYYAFGLQPPQNI